MKDIIRLGDSTTHGGVVLEAFSRTDLNGKPIAGVGHNVSCPLCKGVFPLPRAARLTPLTALPLHSME